MNQSEIDELLRETNRHEEIEIANTLNISECPSNVFHVEEPRGYEICEKGIKRMWRLRGYGGGVLTKSSSSLDRLREIARLLLGMNLFRWTKGIAMDSYGASRNNKILAIDSLSCWSSVAICNIYNLQNPLDSMLVQVRTIIKFENGGTNLDRYKSHTAALRRQKIDLRQTGISGLDSFLRSPLR
ncbi:hypothetical protein LXL04_038696 [Taraxacum kok-saghyz]